jgi:hypothetical protein
MVVLIGFRVVERGQKRTDDIIEYVIADPAETEIKTVYDLKEYDGMKLTSSFYVWK